MCGFLVLRKGFVRFEYGRMQEIFFKSSLSAEYKVNGSNLSRIVRELLKIESIDKMHEIEYTIIVDYKKEPRRVSEYIFCSVAFTDGE